MINCRGKVIGPMDVITPAADAIIIDHQAPVQLKLVSSKNNLFMTKTEKSVICMSSHRLLPEKTDLPRWC